MEITSIDPVYEQINSKPMIRQKIVIMNYFFQYQQKF